MIKNQEIFNQVDFEDSGVVWPRNLAKKSGLNTAGHVS
jgi:hypothetical protein